MGFRDAANLAFKLDLVLRGVTSDALLDTYESERLPVSVETIRGAIRSGQLSSMKNPGPRTLRDWLGRRLDAIPAMVVSMIVRKPQYPPRVERTDGSTVLLDEVLGPGFALLGLDPIPEATRARFDAAVGGRGRARAIVVGEDLTDPTGELSSWLDAHRARVAVVRPDRHVYTAARSAHVACEELAQHLERLRPGAPPIAA